MKIQIFKSVQFGEVRTITLQDYQVGLIGKDVSETLSYANPNKAVTKHVKKEIKW